MSPIQLTVEELKGVEDRGKAPTMAPPRRKRRMRSQDSTKRLVFGGMPSNPKGIATITTKEAIGEVVDHLSILLCTLLEYALGVTWDNLKKLDKAALLKKLVEDQTQIYLCLNAPFYLRGPWTSTRANFDGKRGALLCGIDTRDRRIATVSQARIELCAKMGRMRAMIDVLQHERNRLT
ncbi:hypothetical protein Patl1_34882 [Pistacia atlantica]|uniref:Uncharacterized protein n=1 Tax=Pistacia atlantica TaxID=434234 RepID=A0ACC0ZQ99_9ROSI|nr:hypothetical protein Patl1_34882 [Pistacia atlantica]